MTAAVKRERNVRRERMLDVLGDDIMVAIFGVLWRWKLGKGGFARLGDSGCIVKGTNVGRYRDVWAEKVKSPMSRNSRLAAGCKYLGATRE